MASYAPTAIGGQHFDPAKFNALITSHGVSIRYWRGVICPCFRDDAPDPTCNLCDGAGAHYYEAPTTLKVFGPNRKVMREQERTGSYAPGMASFTFPSEFFAKVFDKFEVVKERIAVDETLVKGEVNPGTLASREKLRFETVHAVERVEASRREPATGAPYVYVSIPLVVGTHLDVENRTVTWMPAGDALVADEQRYSVRYITNAVYLVWAPRQRAENDVRQPYQFDCRRLDYVNRVQGDE